MQEYEYHNRVMGCDLDIAIITDKGNPQKYFDLCFSKLKKYESIFSRFEESSELSLLNKNKKMKVSEIFFEVFFEAQRLFKKSNGVFNPLSQVSQFGYVEDFSQKERFKRNIFIDYDDDFSKIIIDKEKQTISLQDKQELDFGGFLKGYCAQKVSEKISHFHGSIINIGGDIYAQGLDEDNKPFQFSIYNPIIDIDIEDIPLQKESLSTSGTYKRTWSSDKDILCHIIDSKNRKSVESDLISASVIYKNAAESDAWATIAIILGSEKAISFFHSQKDIRYIFIKDNGTIIHNLSKLS